MMVSLSFAKDMSPITAADTPALSSDQAAVIHAAAQLIGTSLDLSVSIGAVLKLLAERLHLKKGRVIQADADGGLLRVTYSHGLNDREIANGIYAIGEGVTGRVMSSGEIALVPDVHKEPAYIGRISSIESTRILPAYIAVPIMQNDTCIGVLAVQRESLDPPQSAGDIYVLQITAAMIGQILRIHTLIGERTGELMRENAHLKRVKSMEDAAVHGIVGQSTALRRALSEAEKAAASSATVLLIGESGCGKERFARMIHLASARRDKPFVCINCAAIPPNLLEAELFGHEKGSFSGATAQRKGKFEIAAGGTLFLDEIGDMTPDLQAKLLRVLQEKTVQRIGSNAEIPVDVRIISATNRQLNDAVKSGEFRLDLYYRLNVLPIHLPPLRDRDGDIELLALYFLARYNQQQHRNVLFTSKALRCLESYDWPGNVRQLENVIERLVIMSDADFITNDEIDRILGTETAITLDDLEGDGGRRRGRPSTPPAAESFKPHKKVCADERTRIIEVLRESDGNKTLAARRLGLSTRQLYYRLTKLKIEA
jgi:Nif-specific regulatory protein